MPKSTTDIQTIIRLGGSISIDAATKSTTDLQSFARLINASGGTLILKNADTKSTTDLESLARLAPGKVIFEV